MTTLSIPNSFSAGNTIASSPMNSNFTAIASWANGNIDNGNIKSGANIALSKLDNTTQFLNLMTAGSLSIGSGVTGDSYPRVTFNSSGRVEFGSGSATTDMAIKRVDANTLAVRDASDTTNKNLNAGVITAATLAATTNLKLTNTNTMTLTPAALAADRAITVKDPGAAADLRFTTGTFNANGLLYTDGTNILCGTAGSYTPVASSVASPKYFGGRLSASSDGRIDNGVTAVNSSTLYYVPYSSEMISLYDGSSTWTDLAIPNGLSIALPTPVSTTNYDVFIYNNSGTPALELLAWSSDTARSVSLSLVDGVPVKSTATTRVFLGIVRVTSGGQTTESRASRWIWNNYNRVPLPLFAIDTTATWAYNTTTWRAANANTTDGVGRVSFVCGGYNGAKDLIMDYTYYSAFANTATAARGAIACILNNTSPPAATAPGVTNLYMAHGYNPGSNIEISLRAPVTQYYNSIDDFRYNGYNYVQHLECAITGAANQFWGKNQVAGGVTCSETFGTGWILG